MALLKFMVVAPLFALSDKSEVEEQIASASERNSEPAQAGGIA
jgi:hypothetical protein